MINKFFKNNINKGVLIILLAGLAINIFYLLNTPYNIRTYDVDGHIKYIEYVEQNFKIPHPDICWECHQAPLYYILAAVIYKAVVFLGVSDKDTIYFILQIFSVFLFLIFSTVSILIFKKVFIDNKSGEKGNEPIKNHIYYLASFLFIFWPTNIMHSVRITNDTLFYVFYALVIFFLIRWFERGDNKNLYLSILFSFLTFITKSHGLLAFTLVGLCVIFSFVKDKKKFDNFKFYFKALGILLTVLFIGFFASRLGARTIDKINGGGQKSNLLVWNVAGLNGELFTDNKVKNYIYLDTKIFLTEPYIDNWNDKYGRQYFWNFLLKNSLFGEFFFEGATVENVAIGMSALLLAMFFWIMGSMFFSVRESIKNNFVLKINAVLFLFVFLAHRIILSANADFRFILPILISYCSFVGVGILEYKRKGLKNLEYAGYGISISFILLSVLFFIVAL